VGLVHIAGLPECGVQTIEEDLCPCGSGLPYRDCTAPFHRPMTQRIACDCGD